MLSWNLGHQATLHAVVSNYQIYAYQESVNQLPSSSLWKKVS